MRQLQRIALVLVTAAMVPVSGIAEELRLIPTPRHVELMEGSFVFARDVAIHLTSANEAEDQFAVSQLDEEIQSALALHLKRVAQPRKKCVVIGRLATGGFLEKNIGGMNVLAGDSLGGEGYVLRVLPDRILVAARSGAGVFYGIQTLKQLIRSNRNGNAIPCVTISDWPGLRYRGWMHDISRGPIPTTAFLKHSIVKMAECKQNFFTLYTEDVFRLKSHPDIAPMDGITAEQIAELTAFAKRFHVELIGNAQSFGHMEHILASPFYNTIKENAWVVSPAVEQTYTFLKEMYAEIIPSYESAFFHINCDEVTGLGDGPARRIVDSLGAGEVYAYHISRIAEIIRPYGKRILMWGDIAASNPQIIPRLPKDLVVISWGYHAAESFDDAILPFKKTGFDFMVAPGVNCWSQVWPDMGMASTNIANYIRDGAKLGAMGVMNTVWNDDGENLFHYNWHGLLWGAECSWNPPGALSGDDARRDREKRIESYGHAFDALFFGIPGVTSALWMFDSLRAYPVRGLVTDNAMWRSVFDAHPEDISDDARHANERCVQEARALAERLEALKCKSQRNGEMLDAALFAARRVAFTAKKNLTRICLVHAQTSLAHVDVAAARAMIDDLLEDLHRLKAQYVTLWERENRSWSLNRVLDKYDRLGKELLTVDKVVFIEPENTLTGGLRRIRLRTAFADQPIYYTVGGNEPGLRSAKCDSAIFIDRTALIRARVVVGKQSYGIAEKYVMVHKAVGRLYQLNSHYSLYNPAYAGGGDMGLLDGIRGSDNFADGRWQGYEGQDLDIVIDLGQPVDLQRVTIGLLQNSYSWILMPERVLLWASDDGVTFDLVREMPNTVDPREEGTLTRDVTIELSGLNARFLKVTARNPGKLPPWHHAAGNDAYIFADEIVVE